MTTIEAPSRRPARSTSINNLEVSEQVLYARMISVEETTLIT